MPICHQSSAGKLAGVLLPAAISLTACTGEKVEEVVFRETMEYQLEQDCGDDKACTGAVEDQIEYCMEKSDWKSFLDSDEDPEELKRFITEFFPCFKDPDGEPYFANVLAP